MVSDCFWLFMVVYGGLGLFMMVCCGFWLFLVVSGGLCWIIVLYWSNVR